MCLTRNSHDFPAVITIDGPAASGKTTVGMLLAERLGYLCFDTGIMYRAVALKALDTKIPVSDEHAVSRLAQAIDIDIKSPTVHDGRQFDVLIDGQDRTWEIRGDAVNKNVSEVSVYPEVRTAMTLKQRKIAARGRVIMLGRDIGTVVLPDADMKIYLDASVEIRAQRRYAEEIERGNDIRFEDVLASLKHRDEIDSSRKVAPLKPAQDAITINTDNLSINDVVEKILNLIRNSGFETT